VTRQGVATIGRNYRTCCWSLRRISTSKQCFEQRRVALYARHRLIALDVDRSIAHELDLPVPAGKRDVDHHGVGPGVAKHIEDVCLVELVQEVKIGGYVLASCRLVQLKATSIILSLRQMPVPRPIRGTGRNGELRRGRMI
jgi:hypothetical protein